VTLQEDWDAADTAGRNLWRKDAWEALTVPFVSSGLEVLSVAVVENVVSLKGNGGTIDWPLRLIDAPILNDLGEEDPVFVLTRLA
tara:strand:- start:328 stop:582 length:255 start_codon:yes stop_codon:yes gene_type:complete